MELKPNIGKCKHCAHWDITDGLSDKGCGQCTDPAANYAADGSLPRDGWRGTDPASGLETGPDFGCIRFFQANQEEADHIGQDGQQVIDLLLAGIEIAGKDATLSAVKFLYGSMGLEYAVAKMSADNTTHASNAAS